MFSGIIEVVGKVITIHTSKARGFYLSLDTGKLASALKPGDSIAVDGVCLTVVQKKGRQVQLDISEETRNLTCISSYKKGSPVNLEAPIKAGAMISGHFVQGHVDGIGRVLEWKSSGNNNVRLRVRLPAALVPYCVPKGSIAINGVSLTIANLNGHRVEVALIPYTIDHTNLGKLRPGDPVNIETDVLGRYVVSMVKKTYHKPKTGS
jgi:riboflavin synthase